MNNLPKHRDVDIEEKYSIDEDSILGEGLTAVVRKAVNIETGKEYAIKFIDITSLNEEQLRLLRREVRILEKINHPNIVDIIEVYDYDEAQLIVFEIMNGGELFDRLSKYKHYDEIKAADHFRPIVDAIRYCHELGIAHRDLKPENILFKTNAENSIIKISDFGFSRRFISDFNEKFYTFCGSEGYFAPEVLSSAGHGLKVDCWSLGVILYVMLCGFHPFLEEDSEATRNRILNCRYEFLSPYWDTISENAKDLIRKLLVLDPEKRLSAKQILEHPWLIEQNSREKLPFSADIYNRNRQTNKIRNAANVKLVVDFWHKLTFIGKEKTQILPKEESI